MVIPERPDPVRTGHGTCTGNPAAAGSLYFQDRLEEDLPLFPVKVRSAATPVIHNAWLRCGIEAERLSEITWLAFSPPARAFP